MPTSQNRDMGHPDLWRVTRWVQSRCGFWVCGIFGDCGGWVDFSAEPPPGACSVLSGCLFVEEHHAQHGDDDCGQRADWNEYAFKEGVPVAAWLHSVFSADVGLVRCCVVD
jgi:hypothetical protein